MCVLTGTEEFGMMMLRNDRPGSNVVDVEAQNAGEYVAWVVDPNSAARNGVVRLLKGLGFTKVVSSASGRGLLSQLRSAGSADGYLLVSEFDYGGGEPENEEAVRGTVVDLVSALKGGEGLYGEVGMRMPEHMGVLVYTGHGGYEVVQEAVALGVDGYLLKPAKEEGLERAVRGVLSKKRSLMEAYRLLGEGQIDEGLSVAKELFLGGNEAAGKLAVGTMVKLGRVWEAKRLLFQAKLEIGERKQLWANLALAKLTLPQEFIQMTVSDLGGGRGYQPELGVALLERMSEKWSTNVEVWEGLYYGYLEVGREGCALDALRKCVDLAPLNVEYLQAYAMHLYRGNDEGCVDVLLKACRLGRKTRMFNYSTLVLAFLSLQYTNDRLPVRSVVGMMDEAQARVDRELAASGGSVRLKTLGHVLRGLRGLGVPQDGGVSWVGRWQVREFVSEMTEAVKAIDDPLLDFDTAQAVLYTLKRYGNLLDWPMLRGYVLAYVRRYFAAKSSAVEVSVAFDVLPAVGSGGGEMEVRYRELKEEVRKEQGERALRWAGVEVACEGEVLPGELRDVYDACVSSLNLYEVMQCWRLVGVQLGRGGSADERGELGTMRGVLRGVLVKASRWAEGSTGGLSGGSYFMLGNGSLVSPMMWLMKRRY